MNPVFSGGTRVMESGGTGGLRLGTGRDLDGPPTRGARVEEWGLVVDSWCDLDLTKKAFATRKWSTFANGIIQIQKCDY